MGGSESQQLSTLWEGQLQKYINTYTVISSQEVAESGFNNMFQGTFRYMFFNIPSWSSLYESECQYLVYMCLGKSLYFLLPECFNL